MAAEKPFHNPFAALAHLRGTAAAPASTEGPEVVESSSAASPGRPTDPRAVQRKPRGQAPHAQPAARQFENPSAKGPARAVVRIERSGRGGKEVTVVEQLGLSNVVMTDWLKDLKTSLGCGGTVESDVLVLQGDQRTRLPALLTARGVRRITVS